ncbi:hypothetical protein HY771_00205, partial [Candidatus Uhrbacteria bacterium]|nr:hypothetical protein [Candidatus Uhrbacteria bacterium]
MRSAKTFLTYFVAISMLIYLSFGATLLSITTAQAQTVGVPNTITYQGRLKNSSGTAQTGTFDFIFYLYTASSGGTAVATETHDDVTVTNGYFSATLDFDGDITDFANNQFLAIDVKANAASSYDSMTTRVPITSVAYAQFARAIENSATAPSSNLFNGRMYYDTALGSLYVYSAAEAAWHIIASTTGETITNAGFAQAGGNDDFIAGMLGVEGNIYTDGDLAVDGDDITSDGDLIITGATGANVVATTGTLDLSTSAAANITATPGGATNLFNVLTGNLQVGNGTPTLTLDGEDLYVEGSFETDGAVRIDLSGTNGAVITDTITGAGASLGIEATPASSNVAVMALNISQEASANTNPLDIAIQIDNEDTDLAIPTGLTMISSGGGAITTALDVSAAAIGTALAFGANDIDGTNFDVTGSSGSVLSPGVFAFGGASAVAYSVVGDNTTTASASMDSDDDLYIEGNLEVDGTLVANVTVTGTTETTFTIDSDSSGAVDVDVQLIFEDDAAATNTLTWDDGLDTFIFNNDLQLTGDLAVNGDDITSDGDLTFNTTGNNVIFADGETLEIGGLAGNSAFNSISGAATPGAAAVAADNDLFIEGDLEVDATVTFDGAVTFNSTHTFNGAVTYNTDVNMTFATTENLAITNATATDDVLDLTATAVGTDAAEINFTLGDDADADSVSGLEINVTSAATLDADVLRGLNLVVASADGTVTETAIAISGSWDNLIDGAEFDVSGTTGSITINDNGDAGSLTIESTNLDINDLTFVGAGTIATGAGTALAIDSGTTGALNIGTTGSAKTITFGNGTGGTTINIDTGTGGLDIDNLGVVSIDGELVAIGTASDGDSATGDADLYVLGDFEVDATANFDGAADFDSTANFDGAVTGTTDVDLTFAGGETMTITNASLTDTAGALNVTVTSTTANASLEAVNIIMTNADDSNAETISGLFISLDNDATTSDDTVIGLYIEDPEDGTDSATMDRMIFLDATDSSAALADGIFYNVDGTMTDAIDVSDAEIVNAINVGSNTILGVEPIIDFGDFDLSADGQMTLAPDDAGDAINISLNTNNSQGLVINGGAATTTTDGAIDLNFFTVTNGAEGVNLDININDNSNTATVIGQLINVDNDSVTTDATVHGLYIDNENGVASVDNMITIDNSDTDTLVASGIQFLSAGGRITDVIEIDATATAVAGNSINIESPATTGNAIDITSSGIFTNDLIDINVGAQAATGDVMDIALGATAVAARALVVTSTGASSSAGWVMNVDGSGIWTGDMVSFDNTGDTASTGDFISFTTGNGDADGDIMDVTVEANAVSTQIFDVNNAAISDEAGWLLEVDTTAAWTGNAIDFTTGAQAWTGSVMDFNIGNAAATGDVINIVTSALAVGAQDVYVDNAAASTVDGWFAEVNSIGAWTGNMFDVDVTTAISTGNVFDVTYPTAASTGNAIDLNMGTNLAGQAIDINLTGVRTDDGINIDDDSTGNTPVLDM